MSYSKDVRDAFYYGSANRKVFSGAERTARLGQLKAMKDFYGRQGNKEEVQRYQAEIDELSGAPA